MDALEPELRIIVARIAQIDPGVISSSGTLADLGVDSLMNVEIAVEVERRYAIRFTDDELQSLGTFASLVAITRSKLGDGAGG